MWNPNQIACARIWLSNTKSSSFSSSGSVSSTRRENARYPVWYSESLYRSRAFSTAVRTRFAAYFQIGIPPAIAPSPRTRDPSTTSKWPLAIIAAIAGRSRGEYW